MAVPGALVSIEYPYMSLHSGMSAMYVDTAGYSLSEALSAVGHLPNEINHLLIRLFIC